MATVTVNNILAVINAERESREKLKGSWAKYGKPEKDSENIGYIDALNNLEMICTNPEYLSDIARLFSVELPDK